MPYALLRYDTTNLGDEIQSIAARQFLPSIDLLVDRDRPNHLPPEAKDSYKIVFNGWHTHAPENWPPSPDLDPLLVSVHITAEMPSLNKSRLRPSETLLQGRNLEYFKAHAPVGARDLWTKRLFEDHGVESYFSGCMTLTLGTGAERRRGNYVCAVDLAKPVLQQLRRRARSSLVPVSHEDAVTRSFDDRMRAAEKRLSLYAHAKCVVTSKLHCALPCLALGTPVLFVISAPDSYRFSGLRDLVRNCTPDEFGGVDFDFDHPPANGDAYRTYRAALTDTVNRFIGRKDASAPLHPFEPDEDVDALLADDWKHAGDDDLAKRIRRFFDPP